MATRINRRTTHDRMSISAKLPSGASLYWMVSRDSERFEIAFANDIEVLRLQRNLLQDWLKPRTGETLADRFNRLESVLRKYNTGAEVIASLNKH